MSKQEVRIFSRESKLQAVKRMESGENVSALSRELKIAFQEQRNRKLA